MANSECIDLIDQLINSLSLLCCIHRDRIASLQVNLQVIWLNANFVMIWVLDYSKS